MAIAYGGLPDVNGEENTKKETSHKKQSEPLIEGGFRSTKLWRGLYFWRYL